MCSIGLAVEKPNIQGRFSAPQWIGMDSEIRIHLRVVEAKNDFYKNSVGRKGLT